jgi:3-deoxy-manno-octulosonate cytidylyltransferase (CMP-KDO synthetase)
MLECVHERVTQSRQVSRVVIATDDDRIFQEGRRLGAEVVMTRPDHPSGTDRAAEVAAAGDAEIVVNVQGDEPLIDPAAIDAAVQPLLDAAGPPMATLKKRITEDGELHNPNVVKVVTCLSGDALYFSRSLLPYPREGSGAAHFKHIGIYVYRRDFLLRYPTLPVGPLEKVERLEQLRALENGYSIRVVETDYESIGVDTPADLERVRRLVNG